MHDALYEHLNLNSDDEDRKFNMHVQAPMLFLGQIVYDIFCPDLGKVPGYSSRSLVNLKKIVNSVILSSYFFLFPYLY